MNSTLVLESIVYCQNRRGRLGQKAVQRSLLAWLIHCGYHGRGRAAVIFSTISYFNFGNWNAGGYTHLMLWTQLLESFPLDTGSTYYIQHGTKLILAYITA